MTTGFCLNERVTNDRGAWVVLRYDANGGQHYSGVYYAEAYAADFPAEIASTALSSHLDRAKVERGMRQWLAGR